MSSLDFFSRVALRGEQLPRPEQVVTFGECRITVLASRLLRLEWSPQGAHDDRLTYAFPSRLGPVTPFHFSVSADILTIDTGILRLTRYGRVGPFTADNSRIDLIVQGAAVAWRPGDHDPHNLRGARRTLDGCRGEAALDPGILSRMGWSIHDDSATVRFDPASGWVMPAPAGPRQDWYFFGYGHDYVAALAEYARFGGSVPMIPRWALGAWWSRYWEYNEQDLRTLVGEFAANGFPLDLLVIDMDWHTPLGWTGYTWNRDLFPDPPAFLAWLHAQGLRATLNLHPAAGVQPHEEAHQAFAAAVGADPSQGVPFHISDPAFARAYFELLHHPLEDQGVDFWWMDWQQGRTSEMAGLDPLPWLNHLHFHDLRRHPGRRPMVFSRWGGLGNHRYPIGFSGDTFATWEALRFQPYFTANAANVLYGWWSHDIGGHFGTVEPELFARWVQLGALSPILRLHSTKDPEAERRPWAFPTPVRDAARAAFLARYELLPYLYTLARIHHEESLAPCRPAYYAWPDAEAAYVAREQYLLGDQVLVAPIVWPSEAPSGLAPLDVWVPPGDWIERSTGELLSGPAWVRLVGDLYAIPQLVRAGAILPLAPQAQRTHQQPADQLILAVYPGPGGQLRLYEDDGVSEEYRNGAYEWTPVAATTSPDGRRTVITIGPTEGRCEALPSRRRCTVRLHVVRSPRAVSVDGAPHDAWRYDPVAFTLNVELPTFVKTEQLRLTVEADEPLSLAGEQTNTALRLADARRLIGATPDSNLDPAAEREALLTAALSQNSRSHRSAIARLGGPFARVFEHTTPEDASRSLGSLVIAAPRDGTPVHVAGVWRMVGPEGESKQRFDLGDLWADVILVAPFAWPRDVATRRWSLDLHLNWRGNLLHETFTSQTLFPTVGAWRTLAAPAAGPDLVARVFDAPQKHEGDLAWDVAVHTPAHGEFQNLVERFYIPLGAYAAEMQAIDLVGYALATIDSPDRRVVRVAYQSERAARVYLNGILLDHEEVALGNALRDSSAWSRTTPVELRQGVHRLLIVSEHPAAQPSWRWYLHVMILGNDGLPAPDLRVIIPRPMLES